MLSLSRAVPGTSADAGSGTKPKETLQLGRAWSTFCSWPIPLPRGSVHGFTQHALLAVPNLGIWGLRASSSGVGTRSGQDSVK